HVPRAVAARAVGSRRGASIASLLLVLAGVIGVVQFYEPPESFLLPLAGRDTVLAAATPSANAFGKSGEVKVRLALPGSIIEYPLEIQGDPTSLSYQWVEMLDTAGLGLTRPLLGANFVAPPEPGFYQLSLVRGARRVIVDELTLAVLVPFAEKEGGSLNGYRIGTYLAERLGSARRGGARERPRGFVEVEKSDLDLAVSTHLRISDFVTHDGQGGWPRYVALSPLLLDKLELVVAELAERRGGDVSMEIDVHSGFRTPAYNRTVQLAARDSRHQYGDAVDIAIDANGDGRYTASDVKLVSLAVEAVERNYPELVGGLGVYTSRRYNTPYAHIDARGRRARWGG
ncbi:MAG: hypothetical protein ACRENI_13775, partial [Gemmatimonadaceae bacterium]